MRYVAQISEYWPLDRLSSVTLDSLSSFADSTSPSLVSSTLITSRATSHHSLAFPPLPTAAPSKGRIILLGTGPGNPLLLTRMAHLFLTMPPAAPSEPRSPFQIDLFLTDKLVPSSILALLPPGVPVFIARKYPGNASAAQEELMALAIQAAQEGKTVCRMKQGDPFLFGRGGEEVLRFREHGFEALVVPGLSSSIGGPTVCGIPVTQRGVAESVVICTAVRQGGTNSRVEQYVRGKTLVLLMGVGRIREIVEELRENGYPDDVPVGILERATCIDQRVLESTLKDIAEGVESSEGRPPGMIVVGWGVMCLQGTGDMGVIKDACGEGDAARVKRWLGGERWKVRDGLGEEWRKLEASGGN
jgi:uroporphyrin-III C-methyltransferase